MMIASGLLTGSHLTKRFGGIVAVNDLSISIDLLEIKCVIGPNGAGKSSLFNLLCGALRPDSGELMFKGHSLSRLALHEISRIGIARKFQVPSIFESLSVQQNLEVSVLKPQSKFELKDRVDQMLDRIEQSDMRDQFAGNLAHGQKQWLEIGMALMSEPEVLLLDEPTAGMTIDETLDTVKFIHQLSDHAAILVIEHDMNFVRALGCHTYVMHQGGIIADGPFPGIENDDLVQAVYLGKM